MKRKIGRPPEYRDAEHRVKASYMVEWYHANREKVLANLREDRAKNPEKYRSRDRARYEKWKDRRLALVKKWRRENPHKAWAQTAVSNAIRDGRLLRQACEKCGAKKAQAHHDDYSRPLDVRWLCKEHHVEHHRNRTKERNP